MVDDDGTKPCPFCGEAIRRSAIRCRLCGVMLTGSLSSDQVVAVAPRAAGSTRDKAGRRVLRNLMGVVVLVGIGYVVLQTIRASPSSASASSDASASEGRLAVPTRAIARPLVIVDEELAVRANAWQARSFTLSSERPIQVAAEGRTHADKGFSVYVMNLSELSNFERRADFRHIPALQGLKVRSVSKTATLPTGSWTVVVANTENLINTMIVRLRVVSDPGS